MSAVWEKFRKLPGVLQKQVCQRISLSALMLLLSIMIWTAADSLTLALPGIALAGYLGVSGSWLLYKCVYGKYIRIVGTVRQIEVTGLRKRPKWLFMDVEGRTAQCPAPQNSRIFEEGNRIVLYLTSATPIYEYYGVYRIFTYLAIEHFQEKH